MTLVIGGASEPCPPCKIILNGGFMLALSGTLLRFARDEFFEATNRLYSGAAAYIEMLATVGITVEVVGDWEGCEQAKLLLGWIKELPADPSGAIVEMDKWTAELWSACSDLAAGKMPA